MHGLEGLVELAEVTETESAQPRARGLRSGNREAAQLALGDIAARDREVVRATCPGLTLRYRWF
jgi:hypothetical protein